MAQRREDKLFIPIEVRQQIFEFIHASGNFHLLYFQDHRNKPSHLPITVLISYVADADTSILEKFQHVLLSFRFREKIRIFVAQFGSINTIEWFISKGVTSWNSDDISTTLARRGALQSLKLLIRISPYVPLQKILYTAAKWGRENIIQCFQMMIMFERKIDDPLFQQKYILKFLEYSALGNQLNVILWMLENYHLETLENADSMIFGAVRGGHIKMLEWIKANMPLKIWKHERQKRFRCGIVAARIARNEQLHVLQWLQENGYQFNHRAYIQAAACSGSLEVLQYLRNLVPPCPWSFQVCNIAVKQGNLEMLKWAISNGCPYKVEHVMHVAASKTYLQELCCQYLVNRWDLEDYKARAKRSFKDDNRDEEAYEIEEGELDYEPVELDTDEIDIDYKFCPDLMDWLLLHTDGTTTENGTWAKRLVEAGKSGNLEYIMWMRVKAAEMDQIVMSVFAFVKEVAKNGHHHVLEWLQIEYGPNFVTSIPAYIAERFPDICLNASRNGHLNILQWSFSNGLHIDLDKCIRIALSVNRLDVLILLKREYPSPDFWGFSDYDISHKSLESSCDIFQWVHLNGCPWSDRTYKSLKSHQYKGEFKDRSEWAFKNGCRGINIPPVTQAQIFISRDNSCGHPHDEEKQEDDLEQEDEAEQEDDVK